MREHNPGRDRWITDPIVQAARFRELWLSGRYVYDPHEFHGPTLSFATLPGFADSGAVKGTTSSSSPW